MMQFIIILSNTMEVVSSGTFVRNTEVELSSVFYWKLHNRSVIAIHKLILAGQGSLQFLQPWQRSPAHN